MKLSENDFKNYTAILREKLMPAMGCTEPIAIAYAAAMTRKLLGEMPIRITVNCSGNIIKNVELHLSLRGVDVHVHRRHRQGDGHRGSRYSWYGRRRSG